VQDMPALVEGLRLLNRSDAFVAGAYTRPLFSST